MRERYRADVRHEVKQAALRQLAESGPAAVSISAIGKQLGMSGPACTATSPAATNCSPS